MTRILFILLAFTFASCVSYPTLLTSEDYDGNKILVQRHADPCCGWAGLRFVYKEGKTKEYVIYYYWLDVPYVEKEVRLVDRKKIVHTEKYQLVFDTILFRESLYSHSDFGDTAIYDINDGFLSTKYVKPTIPLNHIDSIFLFHAAHVLTNVDYNQRRIWLLEKGAGYIKGARPYSFNSNGTKTIK